MAILAKNYGHADSVTKAWDIIHDWWWRRTSHKSQLPYFLPWPEQHNTARLIGPARAVDLRYKCRSFLRHDFWLFEDTNMIIKASYWSAWLSFRSKLQLADKAMRIPRKCKCRCGVVWRTKYLRQSRLPGKCDFGIFPTKGDGLGGDKQCGQFFEFYVKNRKETE